MSKPSDRLKGSAEAAARTEAGWAPLKRGGFGDSAKSPAPRDLRPITVRQEDDMPDENEGLNADPQTDVNDDPSVITSEPSPEAADLGADELKEKLDEELTKGYRGDAVDPTPNEAYTVEGVTSGQPTPETDEGAAAEARKATGR